MEKSAVAKYPMRAAAVFCAWLTAYPVLVTADAPVMAINAAHGDAWYDPQTSGQGFFITVLPELERIFLAWFTFDVERPSANVTTGLGEPGHRWLTASGDYSGGSSVLDVTLTSGGLFTSAQPAAVQTPAYGTITLEFSSCNRLELAYDLPALPRSGVIELQRVSDDKVALCEELGSP
jgi:hypothetical protein